jgi:hypothetical protein
MIAVIAAVIPMGPDNDDPFVSRRDDHDGDAMIVRTVSVVRDGRVSMVIRSPNHDLTVEVGIAEAERNPNPSLGLRDASREPKQQSENDEYPFHGYLLVSLCIGKRRARSRCFVRRCA